MSADPKLRSSASDTSGRAVLGHEKLEAIARFSAGMAHDFNNVLHVVKTAAALLRTKVRDADPDAVRLMDMIDRNVGRATRLTHELLSIAGRQALAPAAINVNQLIAGMQDRLREALGEMAVETSLAGSLWQVEADAAELETAIMNLALNARDAMPGGKVAIETRNVTVDAGGKAAEGVAPGDYVAIAVCDSGRGMTAEALARAFEPYYSTKAPGQPMTGLGLSRVYGFVRQSRGQVTVESGEGTGTTVKLYLPRLANPAQLTAAPPKVRPLAARARQRSGASALDGLRVLVVEDESLLGMLVEDLLEQLGCRMVGLVSSVEQALDVAKGAEVDFALLDVDIGGEPVYPVAEALQARGVPFIFMSGYGGLDGPWRGWPIVQKPFELEQLRREIERAVSAP